MSNDIEIYKIIVLGASFVGKTQLIHRYADNCFEISSIETIGIDLKTKYVQTHGKTIKAQMWDTSGKIQFYSIAKVYYKRVFGALFVFSILDRSSFDRIKEICRDYNEDPPPNSCNILVGTKYDLKFSREVNKSEANAFAEEYNMRYIEVSSKENINVDLVFQTLFDEIYEKKNNPPNLYVSQTNRQTGAQEVKKEDKEKVNDDIGENSNYVFFKL